MKLFCQTIFLKQLSFIEKAAPEVVFQKKKNNFNSERELCQTMS
jgi:hypothetical protein